MDVLKEKQAKNRERQRKYRQSIKGTGLKRIALIVTEATYNHIRQIAKGAKISQGEVIDRIIERGMDMSTATTDAAKKDVAQETVDRFRFEDFNRSELAINVIATMLGFNMKDRFAERDKANPDAARLAELEEQRVTLLEEQNQIYRGNKKTMIACIENYGPIIRARYGAK